MPKYFENDLWNVLQNLEPAKYVFLKTHKWNYIDVKILLDQVSLNTHLSKESFTNISKFLNKIFLSTAGYTRTNVIDSWTSFVLPRIETYVFMGNPFQARYLSRYSDWLRAGRSGDRIPVGARFYARPDRPWGPPSLLYNGFRVFTGGKIRPGRDTDPSLPSSAAIMEE